MSTLVRGVMARSSASLRSTNGRKHGRNGAGHSTRERDTRIAGNVAGFVVEDFVARVQNGPQGDVDRLGNAHRNQDFVERLVADPKMIALT